jgi:hypothetical protein
MRLVHNDHGAGEYPQSSDDSSDDDLVLWSKGPDPRGRRAIAVMMITSRARFLMAEVRLHGQMNAGHLWMRGQSAAFGHPLSVTMKSLARVEVVSKTHGCRTAKLLT